MQQKRPLLLFSMFQHSRSPTKLCIILSLIATSDAAQLGTIYAHVNPGQQGHLEVRCQQRHLHTYLSNNNLWRGRRVDRSDPEGPELGEERRLASQSHFTPEGEKGGDGGDFKALKDLYNESMHRNDE